MSGEAPEIELAVVGEDELIWNIVYVNGFELPNRQRSACITEAEYMQIDLRLIVADAYRLGYQNGFAECRKAVREAIGAIGETR